MDINQVITKNLGWKRWQVDAAVKLIDEGYTIPFISRYRKEVTGSLNDEQLRNLYERLIYLRNLEEKKESGTFQYRRTGKTDGELKKQILAAETLVVVGSLSSIPTETSYPCDHCEGERSGTAGSSYYASEMTDKPMEEAEAYIVSEEKGVETAAEAINGAKISLQKHISDEADYRSWI